MQTRRHCKILYTASSGSEYFFRTCFFPINLLAFDIAILHLTFVANFLRIYHPSRLISLVSLFYVFLHQVQIVCSSSPTSTRAKQTWHRLSPNPLACHISPRHALDGSWLLHQVDVQLGGDPRHHRLVVPGELGARRWDHRASPEVVGGLVQETRGSGGLGREE